MVHAYTTMQAFTLCLEAKSCLLMLQLAKARTPYVPVQNKYHRKERTFLKRTSIQKEPADTVCAEFSDHHSFRFQTSGFWIISF